MMKKIFAIAMFLLLIVGCQSEVQRSDTHRQPQTDEKKTLPKKVKPLRTQQETFHFVVGWLTDHEVIYVEQINEQYYIQKYDIFTGESQTLYQESSTVADVSIHPSKKYIALQTSNDHRSATIKILTSDGTFVDEVNIKSTELGVIWNDIDPSRFILTAFYEDWSYEHYLYNVDEEKIQTLQIQQPFPKWLGKNQIAYLNAEETSLQGSTLKTIHLDTNEETVVGEDVLHFETYKNSLLTMKRTKESFATFAIQNTQQKMLTEWEMPIIREFDHWFVPHIIWLDEHEVLTYRSKESGRIENIVDGFSLVQVNGNDETVISKPVLNQEMRCSPNKIQCLVGPAFDELIHTTTNSRVKWIRFNEDA